MDHLDFLSALVAYLNIGFFCSLVARFSGANASMLIFCSLLYMGGRPLETVGIMITYLAFMNLTSYTQEQRLNFRNMYFFGGRRILIPLVIILLCLSIYPFLSVAIFLGVFLLEVLAKLYFQLPQEHRLPVKILVSYAGAASVVSVAALLAVPFMPSRVYYLIGGTVILALCAFFRWAGNDRTRCAALWDKLIIASFAFTGLFGFDMTDWIQDMRRTERSVLGTYMPFIAVPAFYVSLIALNLIYGIFSLSGLALTLFATIAIRIFGAYKMSGKGRFNPIALMVTVLAVLCLFLTQPSPSGLVELMTISSSDMSFHPGSLFQWLGL